jgi:Glycosyl hydrolases family 16
MMRSFLRSIALAGCVAAAPAYANVFTPITGDASYKLTFDEEFNVMPGQPVWNVAGGAQDQTYGTYPNAFFMPENLTVHDGTADFTVTKPGADYNTSMIFTEIFAQATGYWEARLKAPLNANGIGDNFWLVQDNWAGPQELDIYERSGTHPNQYRGMWNRGDGAWAGNAAIQGFTPGEWHVLGVLKTTTTLTWYLDGVQKLTLPTNGQGTQPMQAMLGITVGPFGDLVDGSTVFPAHFLVDYFHAYSNASGAAAVTPQANYGGPGDTGGTVTRATASLAANPTSIHGGASSTLSWQSTNASTCTGGGFSTGGAISGRAVVHPTNTTVYSVSCAGATAAASVTVRN